MEIDSVCGMQIKERDPQHASSIDGRIYFFCSKACKKVFDEETKILREKVETARAAR